MAAAPSPLPVCGNCRTPMQAVRLAGHYGREVELDLCEGCHLVWFDPIEAAGLSGPGILALIKRMAAAQTLAHRTLDPQAGCARCRGALKTVHNRSRWGASLQLECAAGHGAYQSFGEFLREKGLLRAMTLTDREQLRRVAQTLACVNCGATIGDGEPACGHCGSVPALFDVARLARALDPEGATEAHAVHATAAEREALRCAACGATQPAHAALRCVQCGATLAATRLADAHAQVAALAAALRAHAERPAPHVVARRLAGHAPAAAREREFVERLRAENDAQLGRGEPQIFTEPLIGSASRWRLAVLAGLLLWWWLQSGA